MKRIYTTAMLACTLVTGAFAKRSCDIKLVAAAPAANTAINCKDSFTLGYIFVNNGPDVLMTTDTMFVIDGEAAANSRWVFALSSNANVGDTVIYYVGKSHKNMTHTLINSAGTAYVNDPFANGTYKYPIIFDGFKDTTAVGDPDATNDGTTPTITINCTTGIDELADGQSNNSLNIYPNPAGASDQVYMKFTFANEKAAVRVTDIAGRVIISKDYGKQGIGEKELPLDISSLQNGMYYVEIIADNRRAVSKLTIRK